MRPKYLEISAWGPYKDVVKVDFEVFDKGALFLITGLTGAGKTTIFDGICVILTAELEAEGTARELVNRIQNLRKSNGLEIVDRINIKVFAQGKNFQDINVAIASHKEYILGQILCNNLDLLDFDAKEGEEIEFGTENIFIKLYR